MPRKKKVLPPVELTSFTLTDEDLAEARNQRKLHEKAAAKFIAKAIESEQRDPEVGSLTVPQVNGFDMSAAFTKAALKKAATAGFNAIRNLRKTPVGWVFEALNETPHQL